jgi:DNA-binding IclR family transcriptional regulator
MQLAQAMTGCDTRIHRTTGRPPEVVKSAVRVIEVLEFFDRTRAPAHVGLVAAALKFPQSSTSALLRSLVKIGYLRYDPRARTYFPTERVPLLGNWIARPLFRGGPLLNMMDHLAGRSGFAVTLARRNGNQAQYVHLADPRGVAPADIAIGASVPLPLCAVGQILLGELTDEEVRRLIHRLNAEALSSRDIVRTPDLIARLADVRQRGYAVMVDSLHAVVAVRLPNEPSTTPLVIGIIGRSDTLAGKAPALLSMVRQEISAWLKPVQPTMTGFKVPAEFAIARAGHAVRRKNQDVGA